MIVYNASQGNSNDSTDTKQAASIYDTAGAGQAEAIYVTNAGAEQVESCYDSPVYDAASAVMPAAHDLIVRTGSNHSRVKKMRKSSGASMIIDEYDELFDMQPRPSMQYDAQPQVDCRALKRRERERELACARSQHGVGATLSAAGVQPRQCV